MPIGKDTFGLTKKDFNAKLSKIIDNHRVNSRLIGEPRDFILRSCRLYPTWSKLSNDPDVQVYLRNVDIAGGRKVKLISLERGDSKQPVSKSKLVDALYPPKKIKTSATEEERNFNMVKMAMRQGIASQLQYFRENLPLPTICNITGRKLVRGNKTDVDHVGLSFAEISDNFVKQKNLVYTDIALTGPPTGKVFKDKELWEEWKDYHYDNAVLALVCASANRSKGADGYVTPEELYGSFAKQTPEDLALDF